VYGLVLSRYTCIDMTGSYTGGTRQMALSPKQLQRVTK
jgi:hypothetical protein